MSTATDVPQARRLLDNVPRDLQRRQQWIVWKYEQREGKWTKVPYGPRTRQLAKSNDFSTWASFPEALELLEEYDGVGFVFSLDDAYCGIDLDKCRNKDTGDIEAWAMDIIEKLDGYTEVSPSGTGVHIIVLANPKKNTNRKQIEVYSEGRFFTVTGEVLYA